MFSATLFPRFTIEVLSRAQIFDTPLRDVPRVLLRIGRFEDADGDVGLQIGPVMIWQATELVSA